jgi:phosphopantetheinyl transferase
MVIAYLLFSPRERRVWQARNDPAPRRRDWLLGRVAAKEAVVALVREHFGLQLAPADVEIIADDAGRPTVVGSWLTALGAAINLSISHSQGMVVALAGIVTSESALGVGIDVEPTTRDATQFADVAFTPAERVLLRALENRSLDEAEDDWALRLWCAKEAVGKALGCGLSYGPHSIVATHIEKATGVIRLCIRGTLSTHLPFFAEETFHAFTTQDEAWVVATVLDQFTRQPSRVEHDALSMICPAT